jgi:putative transposase
LKLTLLYSFRNDFEKINQIEIGDKYAHVSVLVSNKPAIEPTGHIVVAANPKTGKVWKLGKKGEHIHRKYRLVKKIKNRESRIIKDLNHKVSRKIVEIAKEQDAGIKLDGIRNNKKHTKTFSYGLNSWSFYQLAKFMEYKAKLYGIPITYVESLETHRKGVLGVEA